MVPLARSGGTGTDARPSASRTAGRPSAPPGRGQAAKAVFRRGRMARIRRMRGAPQTGRAARWQARTPTERPNAPAPTARDFAPAADAPARKGPEREADAPEANLTIGERRGRERNGPFRPERTVGAKSRARSGGALDTRLGKSAGIPTPHSRFCQNGNRRSTIRLQKQSDFHARKIAEPRRQGLESK